MTMKQRTCRFRSARNCSNRVIPIRASPYRYDTYRNRCRRVASVVRFSAIRGAQHSIALMERYWLNYWDGGVWACVLFSFDKSSSAKLRGVLGFCAISGAGSFVQIFVAGRIAVWLDRLETIRVSDRCGLTVTLFRHGPAWAPCALKLRAGLLFPSWPRLVPATCSRTSGSV